MDLFLFKYYYLFKTFTLGMDKLVQLGWEYGYPTIIFLISPILSTRDLVQLGRTCIEFGSAQETEDQQISLINRVADHLFLNKANYNEMRALPCNISQSYILRLHRLMSMRQFLQEVAPQRGAIHFDHTHWG